MPINIAGTTLDTLLIKYRNEINIVNSGLILYLDPGITSSYPGTGIMWYDFLGNGITAELVNGPSYSSNNSGFFIFDGVNDYATSTITGSHILNPVGNVLSFSFWVNNRSASSYYILSSGAQTSSAGLAFSYQAGVPFAIIRNSTNGFYHEFGAANFPLNVWINWAVTCDGSSLKVYKNGVFLSQQSTPNQAGYASALNTLTIGVPNNYVANYLANMYFGSLLIYNKTLSAAEIAQNFNAQRRRYGI